MHNNTEQQLACEEKKGERKKERKKERKRKRERKKCSNNARIRAVRDWETGDEPGDKNKCGPQAPGPVLLLMMSGRWRTVLPRGPSSSLNISSTGRLALRACRSGADSSVRSLKSMGLVGMTLTFQSEVY